MEIKKWTDKDLQTAFEDGCKFLHVKDLQDFLLKRRELQTSENAALNISDVINSVCDKNLCEYYNTIYNRCKFQNGYCAFKKTDL